MSKSKKVLLVLLIFISSLPLSSCWNYREVEDLAIVTGAAIDMDDDGKFVMTVEIANPQSSSGGQRIVSQTAQAKGDTIFDAVREIVSRTGKKLYWSHAKVFIISENVGEERVIDALDWITRDAETREDAWLLISTDKWAYKPFTTKPVTESLVSFQIDDSLRAQKVLSRFPRTEIYKFLEDTETGAHAAVIPLISVMAMDGKEVTHVHGSGVFYRAKLVGFLNEDETKALLWSRNELRGGIFTVKNVEGSGTNVVLEIFNSKTKVKPVYSNGKVAIQLTVTPTANIAEESSSINYIDKKGREKLKAEAEKQIKAAIMAVIKKTQNEYGADIFRFGSAIKRSFPNVWRQMDPDWESIFRDLDVSVNVNLHIRGSATTKEPIELKD